MLLMLCIPLLVSKTMTSGFRDNFSNIKNSLTKAKTDPDTLDTNTAKLNSANDPNGNET